MLCPVMILMVLSYNRVLGESRTNFKITRFQICGVDRSVQFSLNVTSEGDSQYATGTMAIPFPLDENIGVTCFIESKLSNRTSIPLFTVREKYLCQAANKFLGEFWYPILRSARVTPGVCPIPAGRYHVQHVYLDYHAITLQTFPFGTLRFTFNVIENKKKKSVLCLLIEVENEVN